MLSRCLRSIGPLLVLALLTNLLHGQCIQWANGDFTLTNPAPQDTYGSAVAMDGDVALVGAFGAAFNGQASSGIVTVHRWDGNDWQYEQNLVPPDLTLWDYFGCSVDVSGDVAIVGAMLNDVGPDTGSAEIFRFDGSAWVHEQQLIAAPDGQLNALYGSEVAVSGNYAAVSNKGRYVWTYRYEAGTWIDEGKLAFNEPGFGMDIALDGEQLLVGHVNNSIWATTPGEAHFYERQGDQWQPTALDVGRTVGDYFGVAVTLHGDRAIVASPGLVDFYREPGTGWQRHQTQQNPNNGFNRKIAMHGERAVIGTYKASGGSEKNFVYQLVNQQWVRLSKLQTNFTLPGQRLGYDVDIFDDHVFLGAPQDYQRSREGRVYHYRLPDLGFYASSNTFQAGDSLDFQCCGGRTNQLAMLVLTEVNGTTLFVPLQFGLFDSKGAWKFGSTIPPALTGLSLEFLAFGMADRLVSSFPQRVTLQ